MTTLVSVVALALGIIAYGIGGAQLTEGSASGSVLRSRSWWVGTSCQGLGFLLTFVARHDLPLLIVQSGVVFGLAVTALVQILTGRRRLTRADLIGVLTLVAGVVALGLTTVPGPAHPPTWGLVAVLTVCTLLAVACIPAVRSLRPRWASAVHGLLSGVGFGVGAIAARLVVGPVEEHLLTLWRLPAVTLAAGVFVVAGLVVGQWHLTLGLGTGYSLAPLGLMYLSAVVIPAGLGWTMLGELPRPGTGLLLVAGVGLGTVGAALLLLREARSEPLAAER